MPQLIKIGLLISIIAIALSFEINSIQSHSLLSFKLGQGFAKMNLSISYMVKNTQIKKIT